MKSKFDNLCDPLDDKRHDGFNGNGVLSNIDAQIKFRRAVPNGFFRIYLANQLTYAVIPNMTLVKRTMYGHLDPLSNR